MAIDRAEWLTAGRLLASWRRPLLLSHVRPDGDAIGSLLAVSRICHGLGAAPAAFLHDELPPRYRRLAGPDAFVRWTGQVPRDADGIVVVDTCSWSQLEPVAAFLRMSPLPRIVVDHHKTRDAIVPDTALAVRVEYRLDETASAASLLVYEWVRAMTWPLRADVAEPLFVGLAADTGWFRFSNTDARTLTAAAGLIDAGVRPDCWYTAMYESATPGRMHLEGAMLSTAQVSDDGRLVWSELSQATFTACGASHAETEDLIQSLQRLDGVVVAVLFIEEQNGGVRASLRSRAPNVCGCDVDVAAIAGSLGGGGHARAAGVRFDVPLAEAKNRVLAAVRAALAAKGIS